MREHCEQRPSFTRRLAAALVGAWLGASCLFCCGDVTDAHAAHSLDSDSAATQAAAHGDDCCRAHLQHHDKSAAGNTPVESAAQDASAEGVAQDVNVGSDARDAASGARAGRLASGGGEPCVRCSRQVANYARRTRLPSAPARASDCRPAQDLSEFVNEAPRGGQQLPLNRSGTHVRLCVFLI
jgi:hypothetical protein